MAAYAVLCMTWHNTDVLEIYHKVVLESFRAYSGKFLARGAALKISERHATTHRVVVYGWDGIGCG